MGEVSTIYLGTDLGLTEAPHLFRRDGWYYLTTAEGGTGYDHAVTMARSRDLHGPYAVSYTHLDVYKRQEHDNPADDRRFASRSLAATKGF